MTSVAPVTDVGVDGSLAYLLGRVAVLEVAVRHAVAARGTGDPDPADPLRGVFLSDDYVAWLLDRSPAPGPPALADLRARLESDADSAELRGLDVRLRRLSRSFALDRLEEELLVVALAPMLDRRFGHLFGYLNDDVTRRWATVALAVDLAGGGGPGDPRDWLRVGPGSRLVAHGLVVVADPDLPLPARPVRVADRVVAFLLGDGAPDPAVAGHLVDVAPLPLVDPALAALGAPRTVQLHRLPGTDAAAEAATWLAADGARPLVVRLPDAVPPDAGDLVTALVRECLLGPRALVAGPVDRWVGTDEGRAGLDRLVRRLPVVVLWSDGDVDGGWSTEAVPRADLPVPGAAQRTAAWRALCRDLDAAVEDAGLRLLGERHRIGAAHARRAVAVARTLGAAAGGPVDLRGLERGVRALDGAAMQSLARRITPRRGWDDLVVPPSTRRKLRELVGMVRHRDDVVDAWGLGRGGTARGVSALFAGRPGTGKTLAAEVVAHELGVELYTVDLARVVDKYVGETEKNLERVLAAAEGVTGILFFDEADALFGRRGEVRSGQDRYANLEVSFLLQRVEALGAVMVLATNFRSQVDEAFVRRLDSVVEFVSPAPAAREAIWRRHLARLPLAADADVAFCATAFELSGGSIRNAVVSAACLAAEDARPVTMADLVRGLETEYEKLGRLRSEADFGRYADLLRGDS